MTPRHAAALALVGWYLVYPFQNVQVGGPRQVQEAMRPLLRPDQTECVDRPPKLKCVCDSNADKWQPCHQYIDGKIADRWRKIKRFDTERDCEKELATHGLSAKCIASDDPRLKGK